MTIGENFGELAEAGKKKENNRVHKIFSQIAHQLETRVQLNENEVVGAVKEVSECLRRGDLGKVWEVCYEKSDYLGWQTDVKDYLKTVIFAGFYTNPWYDMGDLTLDKVRGLGSRNASIREYYSESRYKPDPDKMGYISVRELSWELDWENSSCTKDLLVGSGVFPNLGGGLRYTNERNEKQEEVRIHQDDVDAFLQRIDWFLAVLEKLDGFDEVKTAVRESGQARPPKKSQAEMIKEQIFDFNAGRFLGSDENYALFHIMSEIERSRYYAQIDESTAESFLNYLIVGNEREYNIEALFEQYRLGYGTLELIKKFAEVARSGGRIDEEQYNYCIEKIRQTATEEIEVLLPLLDKQSIQALLQKFT
jgi:hypothetical protein